MKRQRTNKKSEMRKDEEMDLRSLRKEFRRKKSKNSVIQDDTGVESSYLSKA